MRVRARRVVVLHRALNCVAVPLVERQRPFVVHGRLQVHHHATTVARLLLGRADQQAAEPGPPRPPQHINGDNVRRRLLRMQVHDHKPKDARIHLLRLAGRNRGVALDLLRHNAHRAPPPQKQVQLALGVGDAGQEALLVNLPQRLKVGFAEGTKTETHPTILRFPRRPALKSLMPNLVIPRPAATEHAPYFAGYISLVPGDDAMAVIEGQLEQTIPILRTVSEERSFHRWAEGKWSVKENLGHLADTERIMAVRLLRIARGDQSNQPGFEQDLYVHNAHFDAQPWQDLVTEFASVRRATILMLRAMPPDALARTGMVSNTSTSARALAYIIAGHVIHHMKIYKEKYEVV